MAHVRVPYIKDEEPAIKSDKEVISLASEDSGEQDGSV
jgi:hypothetical protein